MPCFVSNALHSIDAVTCHGCTWNNQSCCILAGRGGPPPAEALIWHASDGRISPIVANPRIERIPQAKCDKMLLPVPAWVRHFPLHSCCLLTLHPVELNSFTGAVATVHP